MIDRSFDDLKVIHGEYNQEFASWKRKRFEKRALKTVWTSMSDNFRNRSKCDFEFDALTENVLMLVGGEKLYFAFKTYIKSQEEILTTNCVFLSYFSDKIRTSWIDVQSRERCETFSLLLLPPKILYVDLSDTNQNVRMWKTHINTRGSQWAEGSSCRLSVKILLLRRLSVKIFDLCRLSLSPS